MGPSTASRFTGRFSRASHARGVRAPRGLRHGVGGRPLPRDQDGSCGRDRRLPGCTTRHSSRCAPPPSAPRRRAQGALSSRDASCLSPLGRGHPAVSFTARFAHFARSPVRPLWTAAFRGPRLTVPGDTALTNCSQGRVSPCPSGAHRERTPDRARSAPSDAGGSLSGRPAPAARSPVVRAPALCLLT